MAERPTIDKSVCRNLRWTPCSLHEPAQRVHARAARRAAAGACWMALHDADVGDARSPSIVGMSRQQANYHLRVLERAGLVELAEDASAPRLHGADPARDLRRLRRRPGRAATARRDRRPVRRRAPRVGRRGRRARRRPHAVGRRACRHPPAHVHDRDRGRIRRTGRRRTSSPPPSPTPSRRSPTASTLPTVAATGSSPAATRRHAPRRTRHERTASESRCRRRSADVWPALPRPGADPAVARLGDGRRRARRRDRDHLRDGTASPTRRRTRCTSAGTCSRC